MRCSRFFLFLRYLDIGVVPDRAATPFARGTDVSCLRPTLLASFSFASPSSFALHILGSLCLFPVVVGLSACDGPFISLQENLPGVVFFIVPSTFIGVSLFALSFVM